MGRGSRRTPAIFQLNPLTASSADYGTRRRSRARMRDGASSRSYSAFMLAAISGPCGMVIEHPSATNEEVPMSESMYPQATKALAAKRSELAPETEAAFRQFSQAVFRDGALPGKTKQLIAVAVAHVTQCPYCIKGHTKAALRHGATPEELMEAIWVRRRCARAAPTPIRRWLWRRSTRWEADRFSPSPDLRDAGRRSGRRGAPPRTADLRRSSRSRCSAWTSPSERCSGGRSTPSTARRLDLSPDPGRRWPAAGHRSRADRATRAPAAAGHGERLEPGAVLQSLPS